MNNTRFFNKIFYIQKYYTPFEYKPFWRFWILGFYFDTNTKENEL